MSFRPSTRGYKIKMSESEIARRAIGAFELMTGRRYHQQWATTAPSTLEPRSFMNFLEQNGIENFLADYEPLRPHQPDKLPPGTKLLPQGRGCWPLGLLLLTIAEKLRAGLAVPIYNRNWYRPDGKSYLWDGSKVGDYNRAAGGKGTDHVYASAVDLDIIAPKKRMPALIKKAKAILKPILLAHVDLLPTSVGWGSYFLHLGIFSPHTLKIGANRRWRY
jgi:hypothetical protein